MSDIEEIGARIRRGGEVSYDEFQNLRMIREYLDDLEDIQFGIAQGLDKEAIDARARGPGVAIVVGHTRKSPGAFANSPIAQYEYGWNTDLALKLKTGFDLKGVEARIFYRDNIGISGAYRQVVAWGAACALELHFNSYNGKVHGTETLFDQQTNAGSMVWAKRLQAAMVQTLRTEDRGLKECDPGDRGYQSLSAADIPTALIEPFFGDHAGDVRIAEVSKDALAAALVEAGAVQLAVA